MLQNFVSQKLSLYTNLTNAIPALKQDAPKITYSSPDGGIKIYTTADMPTSSDDILKDAYDNLKHKLSEKLFGVTVPILICDKVNKIYYRVSIDNKRKFATMKSCLNSTREANSVMELRHPILEYLRPKYNTEKDYEELNNKIMKLTLS